MNRRTRRWIGLGGCLAGLHAGCAAPRPAPEWHEEAGYRWRELTVSARRPDGFTSLDPKTTGITFQNFVSDSAALRNRILVQGGGVAMGDVDGDGLADLFLARTEGPNALYRNLGEWRFEDIAETAGVAAPDRASTGAVLVDLDGDRDLDLLLTALGGPNAVFLNDGRGRFTEDTLFPGRNSRAGSTTSTLADIDGDGDLDLYVTNYKAYTTLDRYTPQERAFDQIVRQLGPRKFEVMERYRADYRVFLRDDLRGVSLVQRADPDAFYLNDGRGRFQPLPMVGTTRFTDPDGRPLEEEREDFGLAARFYDVDGDLDPDLYVVNDFEDPDQFWINDGTGSFRLAPRLAQRTTSNSGMAVDFADVNRDGQVDVYEVDMLSLDHRQLKTQVPTHTALPKEPGVFEDRPQLQRNTLFLNRGDGTFAQIAELARLDASGWTWSTLFLDVDLDGYEDVLAANGHLWDLMDADVQERLRNRLTDVDWMHQRYLYPLLALPNYAFRNRGDLTFEDATDRWHFSAGPDVSHGMATGDLDGDGDLDVVVNRLGAPALVLRNDAPEARIAVRLEGRQPNTAGIGAKIRVRGGPVPLQEREVTAGGLYLSSAEPLLTFAAGTADSLDLEVVWRDGTRSRIPHARPNRLYVVSQATAAAAPAVPPSAVPPPLFEDQTASLGHTHVEIGFDEATRQLLLPNAFSQLGPGVSWYDFDRDGDEDLLIGAGRTGRLALYRNDGGKLASVPLAMTAIGDFTTILAVPSDGGTTLLVGQSSYEAASPLEARAMPSVVALPFDARGRPAPLPRVAVPGDSASVGALTLADYDGDGDLDLFVGARILPGAYPLSPSSRLFRNDGHGRFTLDTENTALLSHLGMVTSALFADLDGDGDDDLLLAVEWGPLKLFLNTGGRFAPAPERWGLTAIFSRWFGVATGDFDADGRLDLVTTSWGRNLRPPVDSTRPLFLYFGNFDQDATLDLLFAQRDDRLKGLAPLASFGRLSRAVPDIAGRIRTFRAYADATVEEVLGPAASKALRLGANDLDHLVWLNRGDRFEPRALPLEAQLAPAAGPVVGDFNGDGAEDVVLSQNFFPTDLNTPRYDAGRGLLLLGDGHGGFTAIPGQTSGILVYGDQRGAAAADYDGDGRLDLVIGQNGTSTRLLRNRGAAPGLRVVLEGGAANPHAVGAQIRLKYADRSGPRREIHAGSGHWSMNGPIQVFGLAGTPTAVEVRWPGGRVTETPIPAGERTIRIPLPR